VTRRIAYLLLGAVAAVVLMLCGTTVVLPLLMAGQAAAQAAACSAPQQVGGQDLDAEQLANAQTIIAVTQQRGLVAYAAVVAVATARQESSLRNLTGGDRDSVGLFQQRVSIYGADVASDPVRATNAFLYGLVKVPNWQTIPLTEAAQAVQRSAHPDAYAKWQPLAEALVAKYWAGITLADCTGGDGLPDDGTGGIPAGYQPPTDQQQAAAVSFALAQLGKPYKWGAAGPDAYDCSGLTMAAWAAAGVAIPRTTYYQVNTGAAVPSLAVMQPGDLIFIPGSDGSREHPGHVGMYIGRAGDGRQYLVQAPHTGTVVQVTPVSKWASQVAAIRRPGQ
jgi:cell wall-associated NlpC family hydrolase